MHLSTRRILHYDIHTHPTTSWVRRVLKLSLRKAIQSELPVKYVISDNDSLFGKRITRYLGKVKIKHKKTSIRSPQHNFLWKVMLDRPGKTDTLSVLSKLVKRNSWITLSL
jgi:hypothetical protein